MMSVSTVSELTMQIHKSALHLIYYLSFYTQSNVMLPYLFREIIINLSTNIK